MSTNALRSRPHRRLATPAWLSLAAAELRLLLRNKTALVMAIVMPAALGLFFVYTYDDAAGFLGGVAALQVLMLLGFTGYAAATIVLAARRQQLHLKRLRCSPASGPAILSGTVAPLAGLVVLQAALLFAITAVAWSSPPQRPVLLLLAVLSGGVTCLAMAFLTAAFTRSSEAAQLTTLPGFLVLVGGMIWIVITPPDEVNLGQLAVPGAAVAQLTRYGWDAPLPAGTGVLEATGPALLIALAIAVLVSLLAVRLFRWEPHR